MAFHSTAAVDDVNYDCCPVPKTHRRLVEAHILWHQSLAHYQEPEPFRANLNALIQALRNVTWVLQSEKHGIPNFDDWYTPRQERLRSHRVSKWLVDARNTIVKRGELDASSSAKIRLVTWHKRVLAEFAFPPDCPSSLILSNLRLVGLANNVGIPLTDLQNATVSVERRWTVTELGDREILEALSEVYALLSQIVLDAHQHVQTFGCVSLHSVHPHFVSQYDLTGALECMATGESWRTDLFELASGQELVLRRISAPSADPELSAARYGFSDEERVAEWESLDPLLLAQKCVYRAKRILQKDKFHRRVVIIRDGTGVWHNISLNATNRAEKYLLMQMVAHFVESIGADAIIDISEMWIVPKGVADKLGDPDLYDKAPRRKEELYLFVATREGKTRSYHTPFSRGRFGGIKLEDTVRIDRKHWPPYMEPVIDVWRRQGVVEGPDGKVTRRLWEPDILSGCFCGSMKRFAECCRPVLEHFRIYEIEKTFDVAMSSGDFVLAELNARAALAQYVIWIRQHTAPMVHTGGEAFELFVEVDLEALGCHVKRLAVALAANQRSEDFLLCLRNVRRLVGVPALNIRLVALAALWLLENGDERGAVVELNTLGNLDHVNDSLALILGATLLNIPSKKQQQYFAKAISSAHSREEKIAIKLDLVRSLLRNDEKDVAVPILDSLIAELDSASEDPHTIAEIYFCRWTIARDEGDWKVAINNITPLAGEETHLAIMLIEHGDLEEAEHVLRRSTGEQNPTTQFLMIDIRLQTGQIHEARELLLKIDENRLTPKEVIPYAVVYAHVALGLEHSMMKACAVEKLKAVRPAGRETARDVDTLLKALLESDSWTKVPMISRLRGFLSWHR